MTQTFACDQTYCDELFNSKHAAVVAELLLYNLWLNHAGPSFQRALAKSTEKRFRTKERAELGAGYTLLLSEGMKRDMSLVPYLVIRGLASEAGMALRRAFEHTGVLTHIWKNPDKVETLRDVSSRDYCEAFKREFDPNAHKKLKALGLTKRFEAMLQGKAATKFYDALSGFDVHGGTAREIEAWTANAKRITCGFCARPELGSEILDHRLEILSSGHKVLCLELLNLVADYCAPSEDLAVAARPLQELEHNTTRHVDEFLAKLRQEQPGDAAHN
jgi:phage-related protein